jgi:6-phospho-beta-glucosidase
VKIAVIGGGSTYTPELVSGFLDIYPTFPLSELWLMDILEERLSIVGGFVQRMVASRSAPFQVHLTDQIDQAVQSASYVISRS